MRQIHFLFFIALTQFCCSQCREDEQPTAAEACEETLNFVQTNAQAANHISGELDGQYFYYGDTLSRFRSYSAQTTTSSGTGIDQNAFVFGLWDTLAGILINDRYEPNFSFLFKIRISESISMNEAIQKYLKVGDLPIDKVTSSTPWGISVMLNVDCGSRLYPSGGSATIWRSETGNQNDASVECAAITTEDIGDAYKYTVALNFDIAIYKDIYGNSLWKKVKNGKAALSFTVKK